MSHPFEDTPQHKQVYGHNHGVRIARKGNGLGSVWGGNGGVDREDIQKPRRSRPTTILRPSPETDTGATETPSDGDLDVLSLLRAYEALGSLTARQRFVVELRCGFKDGAEYTQQEIAEVMGITRQAVARIEERAMERLRKRYIG